MKKVLLIGDSIRIGYCKYVQEKLDGAAEVFYPDDNCRFAEYTLRELPNWKRLLELDNVDIVHWNNGLWDECHPSTEFMPGTGQTDGMDCTVADGMVYEKEPLTPVDIYVFMLRRVYRLLKLMFPGAKIIFALTTPVQDCIKHTNEEVNEFNAAAGKLMNELGVPVNDLNSFALKNCEDKHIDVVHYSPEGYELLSRAVVDCLKKEGVV